MEELNQAESDAQSSMPTSAPVKPKDNAKPDDSGSASSLLSGMTIHRSSAVDKVPAEEVEKPVPTTEKEAVETLPTFRGSVYTEEEEANKTVLVRLFPKVSINEQEDMTEEDMPQAGGGGNLDVCPSRCI